MTGKLVSGTEGPNIPVALIVGPKLFTLFKE